MEEDDKIIETTVAPPKKAAKVDPDAAALARVVEMLLAKPNGNSVANKVKAFLAD